LAKILSHEHFHVWNGVKLMPKEGGSGLSWFTEGFTEYYAEVLNYQAGLISELDLVEHINSILYDYYFSPTRNEKNIRISKDFWTNLDIQKLPYIRGFLLALHWDLIIKKESNYEYSLDDLMQALLKNTAKNQYYFSLDDIEEAAKGLLSQKIVHEDLVRYVQNGETLIPKDLCLNNSYFLKWGEDVGFNLPYAFSYGWIKGVKKGSLPFKAGLRNGQKFLNYQKNHQGITVYISEEGKTREIVYLKEKKPIPELRPLKTKITPEDSFALRRK
jgi:predicted metalloprotease with PDZ domain